MASAEKKTKAGAAKKRRRPKRPAPGKRPALRPPTFRISLFLDQINQEMIRTGLTELAGCDFYASWTKSCCILDFSLVRPGDLISQPLRGLLLRKEPEGGMLWNPRSGAVYQLNEDAYHAAIDIEQGLSELEVARRNNASPRQVRGLMSKLRKIAA